MVTKGQSYRRMVRIDQSHLAALRILQFQQSHRRQLGFAWILHRYGNHIVPTTKTPQCRFVVAVDEIGQQEHDTVATYDAVKIVGCCSDGRALAAWLVAALPSADGVPPMRERWRQKHGRKKKHHHHKHHGGSPGGFHRTATMTADGFRDEMHEEDEEEDDEEEFEAVGGLTAIAEERRGSSTTEGSTRCSSVPLR